MSNQSVSSADSQRAPRPRFSWFMRIFLFLLVFDIVFRSLTVLLPCDEWRDEFGLRSYPWRLPTRAEIAELSAKTPEPGQPNPLPERFAESFDSVWNYMKPWPSEEGRRKIVTWQDGLRFSVCWLNTRLSFCENLVGIDQDWQMFSPNVSRRKYVTRSRLIYEDGSTRIVRQTADPEDLTNYSHWFQEKILDYELNASEDDTDSCNGYCNYLSHRYAANAKQSPLKRIELFWVRYDFPPPGVDAMEFYQKQNGPPESQVGPTFFVYDIKARKGKMVD